MTHTAGEQAALRSSGRAAAAGRAYVALVQQRLHGGRVYLGRRHVPNKNEAAAGQGFVPDCEIECVCDTTKKIPHWRRYFIAYSIA